MRVLLVNPTFGGVYHRLGFIFPPLGLASCAAVLRQSGIDVRIVDLAVEPDGLRILDNERFDLAGVSGDTSRHPTARQITREIKKHAIPVVVGGPHATYRDHEILEEEPEFDFIIRREGELTLLELCHKLDRPTEYAGIEGLSYRSVKGAAVRNPDRPFITDLDALPFPARDLLKMERYRTLELRKRKITPIVTSRGCPFNCPFCCSSEFAGTKWRNHSIARVIEEIEEVTDRWDYKAIAFTDDTFTIDRLRIRDLCEKILERGIDIRWWCFSRPDIALERDGLTDLMYKAGARYVFMGVESGDQAVLATLKKGLRSTRAVEAIGQLRRHGIETMASYLFGSLEETPQTAERTIEFARRMPSGAAQFSVLTPFPGTAVWEQLKDRIVERDWSKYDCTHLVFTHPHFSATELRRVHDRAYRRYYLHPRRILTGLLSTLRGRGVKLSKVWPLLRRGREAM